MRMAVDRAFVYVMSGRVFVGAESQELTAGTVGWSDPVPPTGRARTAPLTLRAPQGDEVVRLMLFSGRAYPAHDGALVSIRKRSSTGSYVTIARTRLLDLQRAYPRYKEDFTLADLPDGVAVPLRRAAHAGSERLLEAGQQEVERQLNHPDRVAT